MQCMQAGQRPLVPTQTRLLNASMLQAPTSQLSRLVSDAQPVACAAGTADGPRQPQWWVYSMAGGHQEASRASAVAA